MQRQDKSYVIGVDIGGTHIRIGAVASDNSLSFFQKHKVYEVIDVDQPIESLIFFLDAYIQENLRIEQVLAVGMGFPSIISKDKKSIHSTPNLECLSNTNIVDRIEAFFSIPVFIENDVNYLLQFEIAKRDIGEQDIVLGFYIGTGFGNSIYINQQFLEGKNGAAAELGHIPVMGNEEICQCGNVGCIEMHASGKALVALHKKYFSDVPFHQVFAKYGSDSKIDAFIRALAVPIATEINIFDPHLVMIGGGVISMEQFPKERLEYHIQSYCRKPYPAQGLKMEYAEDTNAAGILGAATAIFKKLGVS
ncbi:allose kinase [Bacillus horti]|uniref:Allose kinase n=1 Tax=Caldalkalibacillus horti TaxID=77523 RepID=A0ABT9VZ17_9BACI|nr:allose kinase [Bacillus horti]MDQ0166236.1 allose kinase [Bacillus horti]